MHPLIAWVEIKILHVQQDILDHYVRAAILNRVSPLLPITNVAHVEIKS